MKDWIVQRRRAIGAKRYQPEEIISKQCEAKVLRRLGVTQVSYYRWRNEYGGMKIDQASQRKDLEKDNARLNRLIADAELDKRF